MYRPLLEGGLRVPQVVWWPGRVRKGLVSPQVTVSMDMTATCLAAAGVAPDPAHPLDGLDLLPLLARGDPAVPRTLFWRLANRQQRAARRGDWKYLKVGEREFLFDLAWDPRSAATSQGSNPRCLPSFERSGSCGTAACCRSRPISFCRPWI